MSAAFFLASLIVAFIAGIVALAMPCCFSVLLPAYVAKSFDRLRGRLQMTGIFAMGIAVVLLPIAMGATALTAFLGVNHPVLFVLGGAFMIALGLVTLWGMDLIPQFRVHLDLKRKDMPSVFALGVFSGVASSCCAPVLIGVIVLTSVSGSLLQAGTIGTFYVLGMVFPLLLAATVWDRKGPQLGAVLGGRMLSLRLGSRRWDIHSSKLVAGVLFVVMGVATMILGILDRMVPVPGSQLLGIYQNDMEVALTSLFSSPIVLASVVGGLALLGLFFTRWYVRRVRARRPTEAGDQPPSTPAATEGPRGAGAEGESPPMPPLGLEVPDGPELEAVA